MLEQNNKKILITGSSGYIGKSLYNALKDYYTITILNKTQCDLTNSSDVNSFFSNKSFDIIIHCAVVGGSRLRQDDWDVMDTNLKMYYNLLANSNNFSKFIHFGSGAELFSQNTPYGLSKHIIRNSILNKQNFYNIRIFGVFDENELDSRFIKTNIKKYINKEPMIIYQNKYMSFFYMKDLIKIVNYYITNYNPQKEINCCYNETFTLKDVVNFINNLNDYKVDIIVKKSDVGEDYYKNDILLPDLEYYGLEYGIKKMYENLLK